jgi:glycopeptide antibiotics resistance protein
LSIHLRRSLFTIYLIALATIVFTPTDPTSESLLGFISITGFPERFLNLFLLTPIAIYFATGAKVRSHKSISVGCILLSATIEFTQLFIPGRISDWADLILNSLGVVVALVAIRYSKTITRGS